jgi:uncharacterized RDD family membrane protein YckC
MKWLWWVSPLVFLFYLLVVSIWPTREEKRFRREVRRWVDELLGPITLSKSKKAASYRKGADQDELKSRRVRRLPPGFEPLVTQAGDGDRLTDVVLVPKHAYVAARVASATAGSNHVTVVCRLREKAPPFVCRPLPEIDGKPIDNRGIQFRKDPAFTDHYLVEGAAPPAITKWLRKSLRSELLARTDVWLRVQGDMMSLTLYGHPDAEDIDQLVDIADAICAEHGATDASLFGADPMRPPRAKPPAPEPAPASIRAMAGAVDFALFGLGVFLVALTLGTFEFFHPPVFFQSPDIHPSEPWQGGWTTKGFGAFVAAEAFVVGLVVLQTYLAARHGATIGKILLGARVVRPDGARVGFWRVCLRSGLLVVAPLGAAAIFADKPLSARNLFLAVPSFPVATTLVAVALVGLILIFNRNAVHDRLAGVEVVRARPWRPEPVQLGLAEGSLDPIVIARAAQIGGAMVALGILVAAAHALDVWPF